MLTWRHMLVSDIDGVLDVASKVHPGFPEERAVFLERVSLYPDGCYVLASEFGVIFAYAISHPGRWEQVPALNSLLGELPAASDCYYFHDLAMLPQARGQGYAQTGIACIIASAIRAVQSRIAGVAVNNSRGFWLKQGFTEHPVPALKSKLATYEENARYMVLSL